ncbi:hypothetical protein BD626DRAFT_631154 [Schizophyllum amplum]|uniref:Uncharacterized protein n=1 Tax=Schizophyllum amplum TaxID=97359 RepID=A0A550CAV4_9AGAR|nr:hypothetical protein BD626DRAFT_631154 [Auriculariopsis ampla]
MISPLDIPEILSIIFDYLAPLSVHKLLMINFDLSAFNIQLKTLYNLALVSRFWNALATPLLWHALPDAHDLWRLLPIDTWQVVQPATRTKSLVFTRPLCDADWEHAIKVSRYVKCYGYVSDNVHPDMKQDTILASPPPFPLLPSLISLDFTSLGIQSDMAMLDIFLSPSVRMLGLREGNANLLDNMDRILQRCPSLEELVLKSVSPFSVPRVFAWRRGLASLRSLTCATLDLRLLDRGAIYFVKELALIDTLTTLSLSGCPHQLGPGEYMFKAPIIPPQRCWPRLFPALRVLRFHHVTIAFACAFMESWGGPRLIRTFTFHDPYRTARPDAVLMLMKCIGSHCAPKTLSTLHISLLPRARVDWCMHLDHLRPLSAHRALTSVKMSALKVSSLGDDEFETLAGWWPKLERLHLSNVLGAVCSSRTLVALREHCPRLVELSISLDMSGFVPATSGDVPSVDDDEPSGTAATIAASEHSLRWLRVCRGCVFDPAGTAALLSALFPQLTQIDYGGQFPGSGSDELQDETGLAWEQVMRIMRAGRQVMVEKSGL